jgi:class 3 adenylate cyclase
MANRLFIQSLLKYIPSLAIQHALEVGDKQGPLPEVQPLETVVLFSDISGFTSISETCAKLGPRGAEELVFCINRYMEGLAKCITKYGGDIIKFVGDAMIVVWLRGENETLDLVARKAIQSALEIQAELNNKRIMQNVSKLSVKIGIGAGKCGLLHVGGELKRAEFFTVGHALLQALECEHLSVRGGQVIVSHECWQLVQDHFIASPVGDHGNHEIKELHGLGVRATSDGLHLRNMFEYPIV